MTYNLKTVIGMDGDDDDADADAAVVAAAAAAPLQPWGVFRQIHVKGLLLSTVTSLQCPAQAPNPPPNAFAGQTRTQMPSPIPNASGKT